jgi:hypothetical protein
LEGGRLKDKKVKNGIKTYTVGSLRRKIPVLRCIELRGGRLKDKNVKMV